MHTTSITVKVLALGVVAAICFAASGLVLGLVHERESRHREAQHEIASTWGSTQTLTGPVLVIETNKLKNDVPLKKYILPATLKVDAVLEPEIRTKGIFETAVYTEQIAVQGTFSADDLHDVQYANKAQVVVTVGDTRSIEKQVTLQWDAQELAFTPGTNDRVFAGAGMHVDVPLYGSANDYTFSFVLTVRGSAEALFTPLGRETEVHVTSNWPAPSFTGAFLPHERTLAPDHFDASWRVSSFGRNYPQTWYSNNPVSFEDFRGSQFGVRLFDSVDLYTQVVRSVKYAVLFILVTFTTFFLFEVITHIRVHPIQYLLIGSALALFYLLLLSFAEHIGFLPAYLIATAMITLLITGYSLSVLKQKLRALLVFLVLATLYGYLYFVLKLEDLALMFGSLLVFFLLAAVMYLTRRIDWYGFSQTTQTEKPIEHHTYIAKNE